MQYGMAYVEFLSQRKEIEEMLSAGYKFSIIYRKLISSKKITMSYTSFSRYASGRYLRKEFKKHESKLQIQSDKQDAARAKQNNLPSRPGPRIAEAEKTALFGQEKIGPDEMF